MELHHVTAIASHAQRNYNFYVHVMGLRLVKTTVNFDDPTSYHLYYGDTTGKPGSLLTFFIWPESGKGRRGTSTLDSVSFNIPQGSLGYWLARLTQSGIRHEGPEKRFGANILRAFDPDGMVIELVESSLGSRFEPYEKSGVDAEHQIRGIAGVDLWVEDAAPTLQLLQDGLEYQVGEREETRVRLTSGESFVDVRHTGDFWQGVLGAGSIHHVAFATEDDDTEFKKREELLKLGMVPTEQVDRLYFHSVYFREPGGVLFEVATSDRGFLIDETVDRLGTGLQLPPMYEKARSEIEAVLPELVKD